MKDVTSVSLLHRVRVADDSESWREFATLYERLIRGWLRTQGVQPSDADDIVQEVLVYVQREVAGFEHNGRNGAFRNWLRQVTINRLREFWRKKSRQRGSGGPDLGDIADQLADDKSGVSRVWRDEYNRHVVDHLLAQLSDRFQDKSLRAFREIVISERPAQDVADELGMSLGAVRVAQSRVLRMLREMGAELLD